MELIKTNVYPSFILCGFQSAMPQSAALFCFDRFGGDSRGGNPALKVGRLEEGEE